MAIHNIRAYRIAISKIIINKKNKKNFNLIAINNINFLKVCSKKITPLYYVIFQKEGDVVCTYFEYLLYQEYLNQTHCCSVYINKGSVKNLKCPKHESIGGVHKKCKCQHSVAHAGRSAKLKYIHIPPRSRLSEHSYILKNI